MNYIYLALVVAATLIGFSVRADEPKISITTVDAEKVDVIQSELIRAYVEHMKTPGGDFTAETMALPDGDLIAKKPELHFQGKTYPYGYTELGSSSHQLEAEVAKLICVRLGYQKGSLTETDKHKYGKFDFMSAEKEGDKTVPDFKYNESASDSLPVHLVKEVRCK